MGSLLVYRLAVWSFDVLFRLNGGIRTVGVDNVPREGGVILASVHLSTFDPPAIACTCRFRRVLAMAKEELWNNRIFGWVIGQIGAYPIRRGEVDREALRYFTAVLEAGHCLLIFPEGTRGDGKTQLPMTTGVAMLAKKTGVPVVPVGVVGTHEVHPTDGSPWAKRKRPTIVAYGPPLVYAEIAGDDPDKLARARFNDRMATAIRELCTVNGLPLAAPAGDALGSSPSTKSGV